MREQLLIGLFQLPTGLTLLLALRLPIPARHRVLTPERLKLRTKFAIVFSERLDQLMEGFKIA